MEFLAAGDVADKVLQSLLAIALVLLGFGVVSVAVAALGVAFVVLVLKYVWAKRFCRPDLRTTRRQTTDMVRESFPYWTMGLFLMFYLWIDSAMLAMMTSSEVVGYYGVPIRLFGTLCSRSTCWRPCGCRASSPPTRTRKPTSSSSPGRRSNRRWCSASPSPWGACAWLDRSIETLFGAEYTKAAPVMAILAICAIPVYLNVMAYQLLIASGRVAVWTKVVIGASIFNPLLNFFAIRFAEVDVRQRRHRCRHRASSSPSSSCAW